jgi:hypothetical protein
MISIIAAAIMINLLTTRINALLDVLIVLFRCRGAVK